MTSKVFKIYIYLLSPILIAACDNCRTPYLIPVESLKKTDLSLQIREYPNLSNLTSEVEKCLKESGREITPALLKSLNTILENTPEGLKKESLEYFLGTKKYEDLSVDLHIHLRHNTPNNAVLEENKDNYQKAFKSHQDFIRAELHVGTYLSEDRVIILSQKKPANSDVQPGDQWAHRNDEKPHSHETERDKVLKLIREYGNLIVLENSTKIVNALIPLSDSERRNKLVLIDNVYTKLGGPIFCEYIEYRLGLKSYSSLSVELHIALLKLKEYKNAIPLESHKSEFKNAFATEKEFLEAKLSPGVYVLNTLDNTIIVRLKKEKASNEFLDGMTYGSYAYAYKDSSIFKLPAYEQAVESLNDLISEKGLHKGIQHALQNIETLGIPPNKKMEFLSKIVELSMQ